MRPPRAEADQTETRISRIFWVYLSALAFLFLCVFSSLVLTDMEASHLTTDAQRINLSGLQRTHSQRIIYLAGEIEAGAENLVPELARVVEKFENAHAYLLEAAKDYPAIRDSYLESDPSGGASLDAKVHEYIASARTLLDNPGDGAALRRLREIEKTGLLRDLNVVVGLFESNSTARVDFLRRLEFWALFAAIAIVAIEVVFVFRPGHQLLKGIFADLERKNGRLAEARVRLEATNAALQARNREVEAERARLDAALADSEALRQEQAQFTYALSHDLKAPTNTIGLLLDEVALSLPKEDGTDARELIGHGKQAIARMSRLIKDTLEYSWATNSGAEVEEVDMSKIVRDVLSDLHAEIVESGAEVEIGPLAPIRGYAVQLRMLVQNLVENAIRYRAEAVRPRISIECVPEGPGKPHLLRVCDNGIGIDPENHERIFGLFQRLHLQTDYPGSGLGLATCQRIALNHAGQISVQSAPGDGSTFAVSLNDPLPQSSSRTEDLAA